jgi:hypothetical protein
MRKTCGLRVDNQRYIETGDPPGEVLHFVNSLSTRRPHRFPHPQAEALQGDRPLSHRHLPQLLLLRFLNYLKTEEGARWICTLPIDREETAYTGVEASLRAVLAIGILVRGLGP